MHDGSAIELKHETGRQQRSRPYCVLAPRGIEILRASGFDAQQLEEGFPEWRLAGFPVEAARAQ